MDEGFYRAFEDKHRGSREQILQRLAAYDVFTQPYLRLSQYSPPQAVDIGCGRGEWLQLLQGHGFAARGVDLDAGMLKACDDLGLDTVLGDGIAYLGQQPPSSVAVVSAFHVVEHISFEQIAALAKNALRVLEPGGLLIFETPNPDNLLVAGRDFYLDPTHISPLPSQLLAFLVQYVGFARVKVVPLNENPYFHEPEANLSLWDVISGVSPDYAIVAQKDGDGSYALIEALNSAFADSYGLTLGAMARHYQQNLQQHLDSILAQAKEMHGQQNENTQSLRTAHENLVVNHSQLESRYNSLAEGHENLASYCEALMAEHAALKLDYQGYQGYVEARYEALATNYDVLQQDYKGYQGYVEQRFMSIFSSANWRLTAPLRFVQRQVRRVREKGLRRSLRLLPYKLGWWRISQKFSTTKNQSSFQQPSWSPPQTPPSAKTEQPSTVAQPIRHPKEWNQTVHNIKSQSPLEQWNRDHE